MFVNHTALKVFDVFSAKYYDYLVSKYPHFKKFVVHCYYLKDYITLGNVPSLEGMPYSAFEYTYDDKKIPANGNFFSAVIVNETLCEQLKFSEDMLLACIAHEVGHIIYQSNETIMNANNWYFEIIADSVSSELNLTEYLIAVLKRMKDSCTCSDEQKKLYDIRISCLK